MLNRNQLGLAVLFLASQTLSAQQTISDLVGCLDNNLVNPQNLFSGNPNIVNIADTVQCLPQGCKMTMNISGFSDQKATVDQATGIQLPRVVFNCPGPSDGLRIRPSYTLWEQSPGNGFNHLEIGEDAIATPPLSSLVMSEVVVTPNAPWNVIGNPLFTVETKTNLLVCDTCHTNPGVINYPMARGNFPPVAALLEPPANLFGVFQGKNILPTATYTTEPNRKAMIQAPAPQQQPLALVCAGLPGLLGPRPGNSTSALGISLCQKLLAYQMTQGCGTGMAGGNPRVCTGVTGGGTFTNANNEVSTVSVDISGQATSVPAT